MRPVTHEQWQDAVDAAEFLSRVSTAKILLLLEVGKLFGLIDDDLEVNIQVCVDTIEEGIEKGITPDINVQWRESEFRPGKSEKK